MSFSDDFVIQTAQTWYSVFGRFYIVAPVDKTSFCKYNLL